MYIRTYIVPLVAVVGMAFAGWSVAKGSQEPPTAAPVSEPARPPFPRFVAGSGLTEAASENIAIGAPSGGLVLAVDVIAGASVKIGDALFRLDDRTQRAELAVRQAKLASAVANHDRLTSLPRSEDVPAAEARVQTALAARDDAKQQAALLDAVTDPRALSLDEKNRKRFATAQAEARLSEAQAQLTLLKAGAWSSDVVVATAAVAEAQAAVAATQVELDRLIVRAPVAGQVLQVRIRVGEYAVAGTATPLVLLGQIDRLVVRVDIDENDAWRLDPKAKAVAFVRGNADLKTECQFVRTEPYVVPKKALTGDSTERVDTRVLQVLYAFDREKLPIYVGQQMDVFIEDLSPVPTRTRLEGATK